MPEHTRSPQPLGPMIVVIAAVLLGLAVFWVGFMLAPAIVLLIGYLALSAGDKARRQRRTPSGAAVAFAATAAASAQPAARRDETLTVADIRPAAASAPASAHESASASQSKAEVPA